MINLLFDIDGTLTDTGALDDRFYLEALASVTGRMPEVGAWESFPEVTDPAIARVVLARHTGRAACEADIMAVRGAYVKRWREALESGAVSIAPIAGAREIVAQARARRDLCTAIASGGWGPTAAMKLVSAGFPVDELVVATADDAESRAAILRTASIFAAADRGVPGFSMLVVVGDGVWDARAARAIGAGFVGVARDPARALQLRAEGAAAVVPDFAQPERFWAAVEAARLQTRSAAGN